MMKRLFSALFAIALSATALAQTAQVVPQLGLDKTGTTRRVTIYDPTKAGADKMVPIGSLDVSNVFTPAFVSGSNIKTVNGNSLLGSGNVSVGTVTSVAAPTIGTSGTDIAASIANGTTTPTITLNVPTASAGNRGALSSADWSTFNNKQAALVSGTSIKTVGGVSLLGSGDVGAIGVAFGGTGLATLGAANRIPYATSTTGMATSAGLTFDGTDLATTGKATASSFVPTGAVVPSNGMYLPAANTLSWATNSAVKMTLDANGSVGVGSGSLTGISFRLGRNVTGSATSYGSYNAGQIQSDVTTRYIGYLSVPSTAAASFTLGEARHFQAEQGSLGAGSALTTQYGFLADSSLTGATANYGFYGNLAAATGRWNFYANGTASNYMAGSLGIGTLTSITESKLRIGGTTGSGTAYAQAIYANPTIASTVTQDYISFGSGPSTAAASFTVVRLAHFHAGQGTFGAGSAVTNQYGLLIEPTLVGATNNYGVYSNIPNGSGRWNIVAQGTAPNYFAGDMQFNKTITAGGTTGAQTINKNAGSVNFAAAATSLVVTNDRVTANSVIMCTVATNDNTLKSVACVPGAGSFTMIGDAAATAETRVSFLVTN